MQLLVGFVVIAALAGGSGHGRIVREHPVLLMLFSTMVAALYYKLSFLL